jgi:hypothetical protein
MFGSAVQWRNEEKQDNKLQLITVAYRTGRAERNMAKTTCVANSRNEACDEKTLKNVYLIETDHVIFLIQVYSRKGNSSMFLTKHNAMKTHGRTEI